MSIDNNKTPLSQEERDELKRKIVDEMMVNPTYRRKVLKQVEIAKERNKKGNGSDGKAGSI